MVSQVLMEVKLLLSDFIGVDEFKGVDNVLLLDVSPNTSDDDERNLYLEILKKGVYAYFIRTSNTDNVTLSYADSVDDDDDDDDDDDEKNQEKDKCNNWVFRSSLSGYTNGEEGYSYSSYNGRFTANRITALSKFKSTFSMNSTISKFEYHDFYLVAEKKSKYANITYVKSKAYFNWSKGKLFSINITEL